jgi:ABC-2 type transport system ATP-binding protein
VQQPVNGEARYTIEFDPAALSPNAILQAALASGASIKAFQEDVKHLNQAFMDLTEPGVRA